MKTAEPISEVDAAYQAVADHAERIQNDKSHDLSTMEPGDFWCQGDIRIDRLPDGWNLKNPVTPDAGNSTQLAVGATQGSRHCLDSLAGVKIFRIGNPTPLDGPILVTTRARSITHPEHGDCVNLPPGVYSIRYQRAFGDELRAVQD